jgi:predicted unusual protein kinase regulating ubiquinone biosynthesis (AarF/ABC1/UbiB family)
MMPSLARVDVRAMAREISARIGEEVDYRVEAASQQQFADIYRGHPFIRIPEVLPELSSRRVLTMDFVDGPRYAKAVRAEQHLRDSWGEVIYRFSNCGMYELRLFNADPHPGNYLFHLDGTVTFLDFGCVKRFTEEQARNLFGVVRPALEQDSERLYQWALEAGWLDPADGTTPAELLDYWSETFRYLLAPQPFRFTSQHAAELMRKRFSTSSPINRVARKLTMPGEYTLSARMDIAVGAVLGGLRASGPWRALGEEFHSAGPPATTFGEQHAAFRSAHHWPTPHRATPR